MFHSNVLILLLLLPLSGLSYFPALAQSAPPEYTIEFAVSELNLENLSPEDLKFLSEHLISLRQMSQAIQGDLTTKDEVNEAHEAFEGDEAEIERRRHLSEKAMRFLKAWAANFNFKRIFYSVHRYYFLDRNVPIRESLRDLISLFAVSHGTEVSYGVISTVVLAFKGVSWKIFSANLVAGIVIAIPGSDPLCWVLLGSYAASYIPKVGVVLKPYRYFIRFARLSIMKGARFAARVSGLQALGQKIFVHLSAAELLDRRLDKAVNKGLLSSIQKSLGEAAIFELKITTKDHGVASFTFRNNQDGSLSVIDATLPETPHQKLVGVIKSISGNVWEAYNQAKKYSEKLQQAPPSEAGQLKPPFYISKISSHELGLKIVFEPGAITLNKHFRFRKSSCQKNFSGGNS